MNKKQVSSLNWQVPQEKSIEKIVRNFSKIGKYSNAFLKDLEKGLKTSNYFTK